MKRFTISLPDEEYEGLKAEAGRQARSLGNLVRLILGGCGSAYAEIETGRAVHLDEAEKPALDASDGLVGRVVSPSSGGATHSSTV